MISYSRPLIYSKKRLDNLKRWAFVDPRAWLNLRPGLLRVAGQLSESAVA